MSEPFESVPARMARLIADALAADEISQAEFCRRVAVSPKHLNQVLGGRAVATPAMLQFWAFALGRRFDVNLVALGAADEPEGV